MKHIGIAACSAEGASLCYVTICVESERFIGRKYAHPEVTMHTHPFDEYMRYIEAGEWGKVAELMLSSAEKLAKVGASFVICPDNTIHQAFDLFIDRSPIPWLHIAEEVAKEAERKGYKHLGVMGTRYLMESDVYPSKLEPRGIEWSVPDREDREEINRIIFDELIRGKFTQSSKKYLLGVIDKLGEMGCDAVILGCTELPLIISEESSPLPILDSTRILARAAIREALRD